MQSVRAADATTLTRNPLETADRFSKHFEYLTGPSVSTRNRPLSVFFKSACLSSEYTSAGPYDTYIPMSVDRASCFLLPANQCRSIPLILYEGRISSMSSRAFLEWIDTGLLVDSASASIALKTCFCLSYGTPYVPSSPISPTPSIDCRLDLKISLNLSKSSLAADSGCIPTNCLTMSRCESNRRKLLSAVSMSTVTEHATIFISRMLTMTCSM